MNVRENRLRATKNEASQRTEVRMNSIVRERGEKEKKEKTKQKIVSSEKAKSR